MIHGRINANNPVASKPNIENISKRVRSHLDKVLNVSINIYVHSISHMNQEDMRYTMEMVQYIKVRDSPRLFQEPT